MNVADEIARTIAAGGGGDDFAVEDAGEMGARVRFTGPTRHAPWRLHELRGTLEAAGFEAELVDFPVEAPGLHTGHRPVVTGRPPGPPADPHILVSGRR
jgi:hypothetical protein